MFRLYFLNFIFLFCQSKSIVALFIAYIVTHDKFLGTISLWVNILSEKLTSDIERPLASDLLFHYWTLYRLANNGNTYLDVHCGRYTLSTTGFVSNQIAVTRIPVYFLGSWRRHFRHGRKSLASRE